VLLLSSVSIGNRECNNDGGGASKWSESEASGLSDAKMNTKTQVNT
jgi:hypothetical protein